jgi:hypothetical protein
LVAARFGAWPSVPGLTMNLTFGKSFDTAAAASANWKP